MCGIYGWNLSGVGKEVVGVLSAVLALENENRGTHSWGMMSPECGVKRGVGGIAKHAALIAGFESVICHTRFATTGGITTENAHPFEFKNIIGAHNGMVMNHEELNAKYGRIFNVDSQHILAAIDAGISTDDIRGYGTVEWYDKRDAKFRLCNVGDGDLSVASVSLRGNQCGVVWSSAAKSLLLALECSSLEYSECEVEEGVVYIADSDCLVDSGVRTSIDAWGGVPQQYNARSGGFSRGRTYTHGRTAAQECEMCGGWMRNGECEKCGEETFGLFDYEKTARTGCGEMACKDCPFDNDCKYAEASAWRQ